MISRCVPDASIVRKIRGESEPFLSALFGLGPEVVCCEGQEIGHQGDVGGKEDSQRTGCCGLLVLLRDHRPQQDANRSQAEFQSGEHPPVPGLDVAVGAVKKSFHGQYLLFWNIIMIPHLTPHVYKISIVPNLISRSLDVLSWLCCFYVYRSAQDECGFCDNLTEEKKIATSSRRCYHIPK